MRQGRWSGVSDGLCLGGLPVARRPAYRSGGQIKAAALRHPMFANAAQRSASSAESPRGQTEKGQLRPCRLGRLQGLSERERKALELTEERSKLG